MDYFNVLPAAKIQANLHLCFQRVVKNNFVEHFGSGDVKSLAVF